MNAMPEWIRDRIKNPCPEEYSVDRLSELLNELPVRRLFNQLNRIKHQESMGFCAEDKVIGRDEFVISIGNGHSLSREFRVYLVEVVINGNKYAIWDRYNGLGGWRPGQWWQRLRDLVKICELESCRFNEESVASTNAEMVAKSMRANDDYAAYAAYLKSLGENK
jgi:hypothetical protein